MYLPLVLDKNDNYLNFLKNKILLMRRDNNNLGIPNLTQNQKSSFCWFLSHGIREELRNTAIIKFFSGDMHVQLRFFSNEFLIRRSKGFYVKYKNSKHTYSIRIYLPIKIYKSFQNKNKEDSKPFTCVAEKHFLIGEFPLITNIGSFIVTGIEWIAVSQVLRSPGVHYFIEESLNKLPTATIIPITGPWVTLTYDNSIGHVFVSINQKPIVSILPFLKILKIKNYYKLIEKSKNPSELIKAIFNPTNVDSELQSIQQAIEGCNDFASDNLIGDKRLTNILEYRHYATSKIDKNEKYKEKTWQKATSKSLDPKNYDLGLIGRKRLNDYHGINIPEAIRTITIEDIIAIIDHLIDISLNEGKLDRIDSLATRRVKSVGESLQSQFNLGMSRFDRTIKKKLSKKIKKLNDDSLLREVELASSIVFVTKSVREFFASSPLSQFMNQVNPLSALSHQRRLSSIGPGGLSSELRLFDARDIHPTQYGRLCPIETPEGKRAGLVFTLSCYAQLNRYGLIETPYFLVKNGLINRNKKVNLTAESEENLRICYTDFEKHKEFMKPGSLLPIKINNEIIMGTKNYVNYFSVSAVQIFSPGISVIPFVEHNDANRALMGSNMQRQAVPLIYPSRPIVGTGLEFKIAADSGFVVISLTRGTVLNVSSYSISIQTSENKVATYFLKKYHRSNQDTCINQRPIVWVGELVEVGQVIADGASTSNGELALGQNLLVAYTPWRGYNYEDAVVISERLIYENILTSIHIKKYECSVDSCPDKQEEFSRDIPYAGEKALSHLDENGIANRGSFVKPGDILVGKVQPQEEFEISPEVKLLRAIFSDKSPHVRDLSLRVPFGTSGYVLYNNFYHDILDIPYVSMAEVCLLEVRRVKIGDKIAGRHGNKGIISKILPSHDMPLLPDGTPIDIVLNPLGVPSRMNVGQLFESLLGFAGENLNKRYKILPFDEIYGRETSRILINQQLQKASIKKNNKWGFNSKHPGKMILTDGSTGKSFDNPVFVGVMYTLKLIHMVDDKYHGRAVGPYSIITQQPLRGRSNEGGQRFGEMEVWALEAYGAAYTLQEILTIKSDDLKGRNATYAAIVQSESLPIPAVPECFKVLVRELNCLGFALTSYKLKKSVLNEINLMEENFNE